MIELGVYNTLEIKRETSVGLFVGNDEEDILLPNKYMPENWRIGDELEVFVYTDSEDRVIATNLKPYLTLGEYAYLKISHITEFGAFAYWGLEKDLFIPLREQQTEMKVDKSYVIYLYEDEASDRLAGSSRYRNNLSAFPPSFEENKEVDLLICEKTDLGYNAIINNSHLGLIYHNEIFRSIKVGQSLKGYIKKMRDGGKIDLSLQKQGYEQVDPIAEALLSRLKINDGYLPLTDKSTPEEIKEALSISKKLFKKAIGALYKQRLITIETDGIHLV